MLDAVLAEKQATGRPSAEPFRGSLLGSCIRRQVAEAMGVEVTNPPDAASLRRFERGHVVADTLDRALDAHPDVVLHARELKVRVPEQNVAGHVDEYVVYASGTAELWEVKSVQKAALKFLVGAKADHAIQALFYAMVLQERYRLRVDVIRVVYAAADSFEMVEYELAPDYLPVLRVLAALNYFWRRKRLPPRLRFKAGVDPRKTYPCSWCPYLDWCRPQR